MRRFLHQHQKTITFLIGCVLIPLLLFCAFLWTGFSERNLSGLLSEKAFFPFAHLGCLFMLMWLDYTLWRISNHAESPKKRMVQIVIMSVLIILALFIIWQTDSPFLQSVHIFLSYAAFVYMNLMFHRYCSSYVNERNIYLCIAATAFLISLGAGEVLGVSEVLYGAGCSVLLTLIALKN